MATDTLTKAQQELYDWLVDYIRHNQHSPSIRQMMRAMGLKSPAPIQSRLEHLKNKGYIAWNEGKARTIRILKSPQGVPICGAIAAGALVEPFTDVMEHLDFATLPLQPQDFALRVRGDSMIEALIGEGDVVIMRPIRDPQAIKDGTIVAARVEGDGTTLKYFHRNGNQVLLKPANSRYSPIEADANKVEIQGALVAVWRGYDPMLR
jgi:repressor LexA